MWESRREGRGVAEERDGGVVPEHRGRWEEGVIGKKLGVAQVEGDGEVSFGCDTPRTPCVRYLFACGIPLLGSLFSMKHKNNSLNNACLFYPVE